MPITTLWGLVVSLVLLALGLTYKWVENAHALKLSDKEADSLRASLATLEKTRNNETLSFRAEIEALNKTHDKKISDIKGLHIREVEELRKNILELSNQSHKVPPYETKYFPIDNYTWEAKIYKNGNFEVEKYPFCTKHDLRFIFDNGGKQCPYIENFRKCTNRLSDSDGFRIYQSAQSIIENKIRNKIPS